MAAAGQVKANKAIWFPGRPATAAFLMMSAGFLFSSMSAAEPCTIRTLTLDNLEHASCTASCCSQLHLSDGPLQWLQKHITGCMTSLPASFDNVQLAAVNMIEGSIPAVQPK